MVIIKNYPEFEALLGKEIGISPWHTITQDQIDKFANATLDHQWIHTDPERAERESPFKATIAHGYLTVSLLPYFWRATTITSAHTLAIELPPYTSRLIGLSTQVLVSLSHTS